MHVVKEKVRLYIFVILQWDDCHLSGLVETHPKMDGRKCMFFLSCYGLSAAIRGNNLNIIKITVYNDILMVLPSTIWWNKVLILLSHQFLNFKL